MARSIEWNGDQYTTTEVPCKPLAKLPASGPYTLETFRDGSDCWAITDRNEKAVAYYGWWEECDGEAEQIESNLKLLAAAPELLYALMYLSEDPTKMSPQRSVFHWLRRTLWLPLRRVFSGSEDASGLTGATALADSDIPF